MNYDNFSKDIFESISDYKTVVLLKFLNKDDENLLEEIELSESDINRLNSEFNRLNSEFKNIKKEQHEEYLEYVKNEEESIIERFLNK